MSDEAPTKKYIKHKCYETQRAKPWHIVNGNETLCRGIQCLDWEFYVGFVYADEVPAGQILCTMCEKRSAKARVTTAEQDDEAMIMANSLDEQGNPYR